LCRVIDVLAQMTVKVIDVLALLGYRCHDTCQLIVNVNADLNPKWDESRWRLPTIAPILGHNYQCPILDLLLLSETSAEYDCRKHTLTALPELPPEPPPLLPMQHPIQAHKER